MRNILLAVLFAFCFNLAQGISPYLLLSESSASLQIELERAKRLLDSEGYELLGEYAPAGSSDLYVLSFTSEELQKLCKNTEKAASLAAVLKLGFQRENDSVKISMVNPEYLFYAYFRDGIENFEDQALSLAKNIIQDMAGLGSLQKGFGGDLSKEELVKYRYMVGMPRFDAAVQLKVFSSHEEGIGQIRKNLEAARPGVVKVYELVIDDRKVALFGIGLTDKEKGEAHFLPIIGEAHVAAMPYELILIDKEAYMLHGRYRFALHWPELTMGTFTKIMSSPGDVEKTLRGMLE